MLEAVLVMALLVVMVLTAELGVVLVMAALALVERALD